MLVYAAFFIVGSLVIGGLTVDTANVFLKKSKLQRALDASAMAGILQYANGVTDLKGIEQNAIQLVRYNLHQMGIPDSQIKEASTRLVVDENHVATLYLIGRIQFPTFFMRLIPGANLDFQTVAASATSRRYPAVISLVLDTSGSMAGSKISSLKEAAKAFVDSFQEGIDQMALIHFGDTAEILQPMALINKSHLNGLINGLVSGGWTNIAEGTALGRIEIEKVRNSSASFQPIEAILIFTDGAPNVFRGVFTNGRIPPLARNYPRQSPQNCDEYLKPGNQPTRVVDAYTSATKCSGTGSSGADIRNCFNSLRYLDSRGNVRAGSNLLSRMSRSEQLKETYNLGILESDYAKKDNVTIYTIGLGSQASEGSDPYQSVTSFNPIKSYLLRRIANDPKAGTDPAFPNLPNPVGHPRGLYLQTPNHKDLVDLFKLVATKLKSRLVD